LRNIFHFCSTTEEEANLNKKLSKRYRIGTKIELLDWIGLFPKTKSQFAPLKITEMWRNPVNGRYLHIISISTA